MRSFSSRVASTARILCGGAGLLLASSLLGAAAPARIAPTYPPPAEGREPDRTLGKTARHATDVMVYSPDGRSLATAGVDKMVRLWDARTGEQGTGTLLQNLAVDAAPVAALGFAADGATLRVLGDDQSITSWTVATGKFVSGVKVKALARNSIFRPGHDAHLAECSPIGARLWDWPRGELVREFKTKDSEPTRMLAFTPDGKTLIGVTRGGNLWLWEADTGAVRNVIETRLPIVAIVASATQIAAASARGGLQLWPIAGGDPQNYEGNWPMAFDAHGELLATTNEKTVLVWDVATAGFLCAQEGHAVNVVAAAFNPNGQKMASSDREGNVNYWTVPLPPLEPADLQKIAAAVPATATARPAKARKLLVFWRADAILHKRGVPAVNHAIELMGEKTGAYASDFSRDYAALDPKVLANYDTIVLNSTSHLAMPERARKALLEFARKGGGIVGIHAAIDTFKDWPEGAAIVGATFGGHPWGPAGTWAVKLEEPNHPLLRAWGGKDFKLRDEFYEMAEPFSRADRRVLMTLDLSDPETAKPGPEPLRRADRDFAVSWIKHAGAGRVFYCCFGHAAEPFENPAVLQYYLDGIQYALGDLPLTPEDELPKGK